MLPPASVDPAEMRAPTHAPGTQTRCTPGPRANYQQPR
jgi:hypothetical protein